MIIDQIYVVEFAILETERDSPVAADGDRPNAFQVAGKLVQPKTGEFRSDINAAASITARMYATRLRSAPFDVARISFEKLLRSKVAITLLIVA